MNETFRDLNSEGIVLNLERVTLDSRDVRLTQLFLFLLARGEMRVWKVIRISQQPGQRA